MRPNLTRNPNLAGTRIGLILPSVNATTEPEFYRIAPPGISFHTARILLHKTTPEGLRAMNWELASAGNLLASLGPAVVAYACTSGSFLDGQAALDTMVDDLQVTVGCPVIATSVAVVDALRLLGVRRLALATPYIDRVNDAERSFLEESGFEVVATRGLGLSGDAIREVPPEQVYDLAIETDNPAAEAIFISCTDLRAVETIEALESALGKPVLTSNQVTLWAILIACGSRYRVKELGRYLNS